MKKIQFSKNSIVITLSFALVFGLIGPNVTFAATNPGLGAVESFSVLAQTAITGTSTISGNVGLNSIGASITSLTTANVGGTIYASDTVAPSEGLLSANVQSNASTAYTTNIPSQGSTGSIGPALDGLTLTTGVYDIGAGRLNGGVLTLNGPGVYIFRASSDFVSSGSISLTNGARACDVFWRVETLATINGSSFVGTILAGTGVHFGANVTLDGRALAIGGDVTMLNNTISGPTCTAPPQTPAVVVESTPPPQESPVPQAEPIVVTPTTVVVTTTVTTTPKLPRTGFPPEEKSLPVNIILSGVFITLLSLYAIRRKQSI